MQQNKKRTKLIKFQLMAIKQRPILSRFKLYIISVSLLLCITYVNANAQQTVSKVKKIVIDAGHGGEKVPGACGLIYQEKNIVLSVALRLGKLIEEKLPDIEVIYTRKKDVDVPLHERADIANKAEADLFISVHANAVKNRDARGSETYVMGLDKSDGNMEVVMRENSVIKHEDNYEEIYSDMLDPNSADSYTLFSLMQSNYIRKSIQFAEFVQEEFKHGPITINRGVKQAPFLVLWRTAAPSALIEIGFISNVEEEQLIGDVSIQQEIAELIYNAVVRYRNYMDGTVIDDNLLIKNRVRDSVNVADEKNAANIVMEEVLENNTELTLPEINAEEEKEVQETEISKSSASGTSSRKYRWVTE